MKKGLKTIMEQFMIPQQRPVLDWMPNKVKLYFITYRMLDNSMVREDIIKTH